MVLAGEFRRACAIGLFGAAIASIGVFAASRAPAHSGYGAQAILNEMSDSLSGQKEMAATLNTVKRRQVHYALKWSAGTELKGDFRNFVRNAIE